jgi:hypothetical protein
MKASASHSGMWTFFQTLDWRVVKKFYSPVKSENNSGLGEEESVRVEKKTLVFYFYLPSFNSTRIW